MHMCNFLFNEGTSWYDTLGNDPWSCEPVGFRCGDMIFSIGWVMVRVQERLLLGHPSRLCQFLLSGLTSVSAWWLWWLWIHSDLPGLPQLVHGGFGFSLICLVWPWSVHGGYGFCLTWFLCCFWVAPSLVLPQKTLIWVNCQRCLNVIGSCDWLPMCLQNPHFEILTQFLTPNMMIL